MRRIAETSIEAYEYLKRENKLKPTQQEVLQVEFLQFQGGKNG